MLWLKPFYIFSNINISLDSLLEIAAKIENIISNVIINRYACGMTNIVFISVIFVGYIAKNKILYTSIIDNINCTTSNNFMAIFSQLLIFKFSISFVNGDTNLSLSINRIAIPNRIETPRLIIADNDNNGFAVSNICVLRILVNEDTKDVVTIVEEYIVISVGIIETINIFDIPLIT